jgi:choline dehydrogenase
VLLVEAGGPDSRLEIHDEALTSTFSLWGAAELDWGYVTKPQAALNGRTILVARGKVWCGSSSINAMLHVRGNRLDYDHWDYLGNEGWSYAEVLPYFKKSEDFEGGASEYRGVGGPLSVIYHADPTPVLDRLFLEASEVGFRDRGTRFDYNAEQQDDSPFYYQTTKTREHKRASTAVSFLYAIMKMPNFTLRSQPQVTQPVLEGNHVVGVEYLQDGRIVRAGAQQEVIVCDGAYESPKVTYALRHRPRRNAEDPQYPGDRRPTWSRTESARPPDSGCGLPEQARASVHAHLACRDRFLYADSK